MTGRQAIWLLVKAWPRALWVIPVLVAHRMGTWIIREPFYAIMVSISIAGCVAAIEIPRRAHNRMMETAIGKFRCEDGTRGYFSSAVKTGGGWEFTTVPAACGLCSDDRPRRLAIEFKCTVERFK